MVIVPEEAVVGNSFAPARVVDKAKVVAVNPSATT